MQVKVHYILFENFSSHITYCVDKVDYTDLKERLWNDLKDINWDWPLTKDSVEITKVIIVDKTLGVSEQYESD